VLSGITGWAQIIHKYGDTITKPEYDLDYIKNLWFAMDIYIALKRLKTVNLGLGAQQVRRGGAGFPALLKPAEPRRSARCQS